MTDDESCAESRPAVVESAGRRRTLLSRLPWSELLPQAERSLAIWMAAALVAVQVGSLAGDTVWRLLGAPSGSWGSLLANAFRLAGLLAVVAVGVTKYRVPKRLVGFVVATSAADVIAAGWPVVLYGILDSFVRSPEGYTMVSGTVRTFWTHGHSLVVTIAVAMMFVVVWKREQATDQLAGSPAGPGPAARALDRVRRMLGLARESDPAGYRLVLGVAAVNVCVVLIRSLIVLPANLVLQATGALPPWNNALVLLGPTVVLAVVLGIAFAKFELPVSSWLPLSAPYVASTVLNAFRLFPASAYGAFAVATALNLVQVGVIAAYTAVALKVARQRSEQALQPDASRSVH